MASISSEQHLKIEVKSIEFIYSIRFCSLIDLSVFRIVDGALQIIEVFSLVDVEPGHKAHGQAAQDIHVLGSGSREGQTLTLFLMTR